MSRRFEAALVVASTFAAVTPAAAQTAAPALNQSVWLQLGALRASADSTARLDRPGSGQAGTDVNLERDLGLSDRRTLGSMLLGWRSPTGWRGELEYFALSRQARSRVLASDIRWGDTVYPASVDVDSTVDSKVMRIGAGYSYLRTPNAELGVVAGLHVTRFNVTLVGEGQVGDSGPITVRREHKSATVPLPTIGAFGTWGLSPSWLLAARADVLRLKLRGYDGRLVNVSADVIYRLTPNVGLGGGYRLVDYRLSGSRSDYTGRFEYRVAGPQVFLDLGF